MKALWKQTETTFDEVSNVTKITTGKRKFHKEINVNAHKWLSTFLFPGNEAAGQNSEGKLQQYSTVVTLSQPHNLKICVKKTKVDAITGSYSNMSNILLAIMCLNYFIP